MCIGVSTPLRYGLRDAGVVACHSGLEMVHWIVGYSIVVECVFEVVESVNARAVGKTFQRLAFYLANFGKIYPGSSFPNERHFDADHAYAMMKLLRFL